MPMPNLGEVGTLMDGTFVPIDHQASSVYRSTGENVEQTTTQLANEDGLLSQRIYDESLRALGAEQTLRESVINEADRSQHIEQELHDTLDGEIIRAKAAESVLQDTVLLYRKMAQDLAIFLRGNLQKR